MATELKLTVNRVSIPTDYFVKEFTEHTVVGMMGGLKDTGEVKDLRFSLKDARLDIEINGRPVPVNEFATRIIITTLEGLLKPLKEVTFPVDTVEIEIHR